MTDASSIRDFHAHIYFDQPELAEARALAAAVADRFGVPIGHLHIRPSARIRAAHAR